MQLVLPYNIINNTPADAVQVDTNYDTIAAFVNSQVINRDGGVAMTAPLLLSGNPTEPNHAANKAYMDGFLPVGIIMPFGGAGAPAGQWLLCDGSAKSTTTYAKLFNVLGYNYGGSGGNFNVPDMRGRFPIGMDTAQPEFAMVGKKGGSFTVPVPQHSHAMPHQHPINHDHASFDTGNNKTDHYHAINHDHPNVTANVDLSVRASAAAGGGHSVMPSGADGTTSSYTNNPTVAVNVPSYTGNSGVNTTDHAHAANVPSFVGTSGAASTPNTSNTGTAAVELQPPFTTVNYIIRAS